MAGAIHTGDINQLRRNLTDVFNTVIATTPGILQLINATDNNKIGKDKKFEWLEYARDYERDTLNNGGVVSAGDTTFIVTDSDKFKLGAICRWEDSVSGETFRVTAIASATHTLTVTREINGISAPTTIADSSKIRILTTPVLEGSRANLESIEQSTVQYNYSQRFRRDFGFSEAIADMTRYGYANGQAFISEKTLEKLEDLRNELNATVLNGARYAGTATIPSTLGGIYWWLHQADTNKQDASASALSATLLNNLLAELYERNTKGASGLILYMTPIQARVMSDFNTAIANQMVMLDRGDKTASGTLPVLNYESDLKGVARCQVVIDKDAQPGTVAILNPKDIELSYVTNKRLVQWDTTPNDAVEGAKQVGLFSHCSLKFKNHTKSHALLYNLKPTRT